ncbi:hypothetical protein VP01_801g8 [Puccinia sorghi]|uniref:Uncharacterized protein n=1 Tax=Puccinia sorghi TaxID=27349 RepID=A0A0L6UCK6_9BASI|nr:hypothetical protein VP01_801g8 [Puccinia sorghi]
MPLALSIKLILANVYLAFFLLLFLFEKPFNLGKLVLFQVQSVGPVWRTFKLIPWVFVGLCGGIFRATFIRISNIPRSVGPLAWLTIPSKKSWLFPFCRPIKFPTSQLVEALQKQDVIIKLHKCFSLEHGCHTLFSIVFPSEVQSSPSGPLDFMKQALEVVMKELHSPENSRAIPATQKYAHIKAKSTRN